jgi:hypothetical protein
MTDFTFILEIVLICDFPNFIFCSCEIHLGVFAGKEERDGCICIWRGWNRWSSDAPHSGGPEIPVYDVIREFFLGLTDVIC